MGRLDGRRNGRIKGLASGQCWLVASAQKGGTAAQVSFRAMLSCLILQSCTAPCPSAGYWGTAEAPCMQGWFHNVEPPLSRGAFTRLCLPLARGIDRLPAKLRGKLPP